MIRSSICGTICLLVFSATVVAAPPETRQPPAAISPAADAKPAQPVAGRKQIEALLQAPAQLDFGTRKAITVQELLDQLHQQHRLSIRFDRPTLAGIYGSGAKKGSATECPPAAVAHTSLGTRAGQTLGTFLGRQGLPASDQLVPPRYVTPIAEAAKPASAGNVPNLYGAQPI